MASTNLLYNVLGPFTPMEVSGLLNFTLNSGGASIDRIAWTMQMPRADTITHIGFRYGARTGTPVAHDIGLQGFSATGTPDGTWLGGGSAKKGSFTPPASTAWNGTWQWVALANSHIASKGEQLMIVCEPTGTPDGSNNSSFTRYGVATTGRVYPYYLVMADGGAWTKGTQQPCVAVKSATTVYGFPFLDPTQVSIGTNGHRQANKFIFPSGSVTTLSVIGLRMRMSPEAAGNSIIAGIWDATGSVVTAITLDSDIVSTSLGELTVFFDDDAVNLLPNTGYYAGIERASASCYLYQWLVDNANDQQAFPLGTNCHWSEWNGSTWTDTTTKRATVDLIIDDITSSGGSGGGGIFGRVLT